MCITLDCLSQTYALHEKVSKSSSVLCLRVIDVSAKRQVRCKEKPRREMDPLTFIITSAKEVMFLSDFVCLFVCLCVSKITQKVMDGSF